MYFVENTLRVTINSILSIEIGKNWWDVAVDFNIRTKVERFKSQYKGSKLPTIGRHGLYFIGLGDLNEIVRANANLIQPIVPDIQDWIVRIEQLRLPRNYVAHMNHPSNAALELIDALYRDAGHLLGWLVKNNITALVP